MRSETGTIINNNYPGELITFLNLNLPPAFKGAVGELLLLFLSTCSHASPHKNLGNVTQPTPLSYA